MEPHVKSAPVCQEPNPEEAPHLDIASRVLVVRHQRVLLDTDLARLYGVTTKRLNEQVKRNISRFPSDFMFQLAADEKAHLVAICDHLRRLRFSPALPYAFTEHGAIQAANVLATSQAVEFGIHVVRAFVRMRELSAVQTELGRRLEELEHKLGLVSAQHSRFSEETRTQLRRLMDAIRVLAQPAGAPSTRPIGFVPPSSKNPGV